MEAHIMLSTRPANDAVTTIASSAMLVRRGAHQSITSLCAAVVLLLGPSSHYSAASALLPPQRQHLWSRRNIALHSQVEAMRHVGGIEQVAQDHDVFLLDMWGVMHDGSKPYEGVLDTVRRLKDAGKRLVILSNSSKRRDNSVRMLTKLGFDVDDFDQIITSGELSYRMLSGDETLACETWPVLSKIREGDATQKVYCFGSGNQDEEYCESSGWTLAPLEDANLILARGTFTINDGSGTVVSKNEDEKEYFRILNKSLEMAASRRIPMLVSNPDKVRPDAGLPPMPGAIGDAYEEALGGGEHAERLVKRIGKPYREVFDLALGDTDATRACMIGDALETDVTGAMKIGCTAVWVVNDGIHGPDIAQKGNGIMEVGTAEVLREFNDKTGTYAKDSVLSPSLCVPHFRW